MAIKKNADIGNTGLNGEYWALCDLQIHTGDKPSTIKFVGRYALWVTATARAEGRSPLRRTKRVIVSVEGTDPKLSEIEAVFEKALLRESIQPVRGVHAVSAIPGMKAKKAVPAKAAVEADPDNGIEAQPAVEAQAAVEGRVAIDAVKAVRAVAGVRGGELEGGTII